MSLKSRLSWMISGPARLDEMHRSIQALQQQVDALQSRQEEQLAEIRSTVEVVLDDVSARLSTLSDADRTDP